MKRFLAILFLLLAVGAMGADYCVGPTSAGSADGSDWTNRLAFDPSTMVRGNVYYLMDGDYGALTTENYNVAHSGTSTITIKKAIESDHVTDNGWDSAYGDGEAVLPMMEFFTGYWIFDGQTRGTDWVSGYGFRVPFDWHDWCVDYYGGDNDAPSNQWYYVEFDGPAGSGDFDAGDAPWLYTFRVLPSGTGGYDDTSGMVISRCWLHGSTTHLQDNGGNDGIIIEYSILSDSRNTNDADHGNIYWIGSSGGIFRYNIVTNYNPEGLLFGLDNSDWQVYGNVFADGVVVARGIEIYGSRTHINTKIYNNTFSTMPLAAIRIEAAASCSGVQIYNNLSYNSGGIDSHSGVTYANNDTTVDTGDFLDYANRNFRLSGATDPGTSLSSPFDTDPDGQTRGSDGNWDVGAYEYDAGTTNPPTITSSDATGTNGIAFSYWITALNNPTNYDASGLPGGLTVNTNTGQISGTPNETVTNTVTLAATNAYGGTNLEVTFTIWPPQPYIGLSTNAHPFGYIGLGYTSDYTIYVTNIGAGTLSGSATVSSPFTVYSGGTYSLGADESQAVVVRYTPTDIDGDGASVSFSGAQGATTAVSGQGYYLYPANTTIWLSTNLIVAPMESNVLNSIWQTQDTGDGPTDGGLCLLGFNAPTVGYLQIAGTVIATNTAQDSFFIGWQTPPTATDIWDMPSLDGFAGCWVSIRGSGTFDNPEFTNKVFAASAGPNALYIYGREAAARLQTVEFQFTGSNSVMNAGTLNKR